jgi:hypothetical protein
MRQWKSLAICKKRLCLADLERRIGRWLTFDDFENCPMGVPEHWESHITARSNAGAICRSLGEGSFYYPAPPANVRYLG